MLPTRICAFAPCTLMIFRQSSGSGSSEVFNGQAAALNPVTDELPTILTSGRKTCLIKLARRSSRYGDDHTERRRGIPYHDGLLENSDARQGCLPSAHDDHGGQSVGFIFR